MQAFEYLVYGLPSNCEECKLNINGYCNLLEKVAASDCIIEDFQEQAQWEIKDYQNRLLNALLDCELHE